jgi:cobalt-zinc-cadmium efflux system protein
MAHDDHAHGSRHENADSRGALVLAAGANTILLVVQVAGALAFGSVALLADSVHQASDVVSLILAVGIAILVARPASNRYTFGFRRADALGGVLHAVLLVVAAVFVIIEAVHRWGGDREINGVGVVVIAVAGLLVNGLSATWLHGAHGHSLNVEGAVLHLVADALGSLVVLVGGVAVLLTDESRVDAVASFVVVGLIIWSAFRLARASLHVLMDGVPEGFDPEELRDSMLADPLVVDAHHMHVRTLDGATVSLTAHVQVDTEELHEAQMVVGRLTTMLAERGVAHVTLQAECHPCYDDDC